VKKWTKDGLMKLSDAELSSLHENVQSTAQRKCTKFTEEAIALLPLIEGEQKRRAASHAPEVGKVRRRPRTERVRIERQYADAIVCLIKSLSERFDLSPEAAIRRSLGFPGFVPRSPLDRYGDALVGGARRAGLVSIDRYTAYRIKDDTVSLTVLLEENASPIKLKFIVQASKERLNNPQCLVLIRKTANDEASLRRDEVGELFDDFDGAAKFYEKLIAALAPKRVETD
jgi:hypothetical protein